MSRMREILLWSAALLVTSEATREMLAPSDSARSYPTVPAMVIAVPQPVHEDSLQTLGNLVVDGDVVTVVVIQSNGQDDGTVTFFNPEIWLVAPTGTNDGSDRGSEHGVVYANQLLAFLPGRVLEENTIGAKSGAIERRSVVGDAVIAVYRYGADTGKIGNRVTGV